MGRPSSPRSLCRPGSGRHPRRLGGQEHSQWLCAAILQHRAQLLRRVCVSGYVVLRSYSARTGSLCRTQGHPCRCATGCCCRLHAYCRGPDRRSVRTRHSQFVGPRATSSDRAHRRLLLTSDHRHRVPNATFRLCNRPDLRLRDRSYSMRLSNRQHLPDRLRRDLRHLPDMQPGDLPHL